MNYKKGIMNYEQAWKELKSLMGNEIILLMMDSLEKEYDDRAICIKDKDSEFIKGNRYEIVDQDQHYIYLNGERGCRIFLTYGEYTEHFKEK